jgi:YD repeat-containing protein
MVEIVSGGQLGLTNSSLALLGNGGGVGNAQLGQNGDQVYLNAATGNLVIQSADEILAAAGSDLSLIRTYNSQGLMNDANGDNWRLNIDRRVYGLTGTVNTAGSTITKMFGDGTEVVYTYNTTQGVYVATDGPGANDILAYSATLLQWTWTDGSTRTTEAYNSVGQMTQSTDINGNKTAYTYTGSYLTQITDPSGQSTYLDYTGNNLTDIRVVSGGLTQTRTRYGYDSSNRLSMVTVDLTPADNSITDGKTFTTTYAYDSTSDRVASIMNSDGTTVSFTYTLSNGAYRVASYKDGDGNATALNYTVPATVTNATPVNLLARASALSATIPPYYTVAAGATWASVVLAVYGSSDAAAATRLQTAMGSPALTTGAHLTVPLTLTYTPAATAKTINEQITITSPLGQVTTVKTDAQGRVVALQSPSVGTGPLETDYTYDASGNVLTIRQDPTGRDLVTTLVYDANGNVVSRTDAVGNTVTSTYSATNQLLTETTYTGVSGSSGPQTTRYAYDFRGNLRFVVTPQGRVTEYRYNSVGSRVSQIEYVTAPIDVSALTPSTALTETQLITWVATQVQAQAQVQQTDYAYDFRGNPTTSTAYASTASGGSASGLTLVGTDIGTTGAVGSSGSSGTTTTVSGAGADVWGTADAFQFDAQAFTGDGTITARVSSQTPTNYWAKAGVMIRETLAAGSTNVFVALTPGTITPNNGAVMQSRSATNGNTVSAQGSIVNAPYWARITRAGNTFTGYVSADGLTWTQISQVTVAMASTVYAGLAVSSHVAGTLSTAVFDHVSLVSPAGPALVGADVGTPTAAGSSAPSGTTIVVNGAGADVWNASDSFQFDSQALSGNGTITARVVSQTNTNAVAKAGVMFRETLAAGSANVFMELTPTSGSVMQSRAATNAASTSVHGTAVAAPYWVRLTRAGNTFTGFISVDGVTWTQVNQVTVPMAATVYAGLAVTSHVSGTLSTAVFDNVSIVGGPTTPAAGASITQYVYDQRGLLLQRIDPRGALTPADPTDYVTNYTYDGLGRPLTTVRWTAAGNVTTSTDIYTGTAKTASVTLANGLVSTSTYDAAGRLLSVAESSGGTALGTTKYTYDANGQLRRVTDPLGNVTDYVYDAAGRKIFQVDGTGDLIQYVYDQSSNLAETIRYAAPVTRSLLSDASGNPLAAVNAASLIASAEGNSANDVVTRNIYDSSNRLVYSIDGVGDVTAYTYDSASRLVSTLQYATAVTIARTVGVLAFTAGSINGTALATSVNDRLARRFYDSDGRLVGSLDAAGYLTQEVYDSAGNLVETIAYATATTAASRAAGTLAQLVPAADTINDQITYYFYDGEGRQVGVIDAEHELTQTVYDVAGNPIQVVRFPNVVTWTGAPTLAAVLPTSTAGAHITAYQYNELNQVTQTTNYEGTVSTYQYDSVGNLITKTLAVATVDSEIYQSRYDAQGNLIETLSPQGSAQITGGMTTAQINAIWAQYGTIYTYDADGHRASMTDPAGNVTHYYYDADGRQTLTVNGVGEVTETRYNSLNQVSDRIDYVNLVSVTGLTGGLVTPAVTALVSAAANAALDSHTTYTYTLAGQLATTTTAEGGKLTDVYDAFGDVTLSVQALTATTSMTTANTYDARGELLTTAADPSGINAIQKRQYDAFGRLYSYIDPNSNAATIYSYDRLGRTVLVVDPLTLTHRTTYDAFSRVLTTVDALTQTTSYTYNDAARSVAIMTPAGVTTTTVHNAMGQTFTVTDGRGNTTTYSYDHDGELRSISDGLGTLESRTYDAAGREVTATDASGIITSFAYDAANRILTQIVDSAPGGLALKTSYVYDSTFNGVSHVIVETDPTGHQTVTSYDRDGRVAKVTIDPSGLAISTGYTYDEASHVLTVTEGLGSANPRRTQYQYDALGRRTADIVDPTALGGTLNLTTQYKYDANGNLDHKIDAAGNSTWYVYDADNRLIDTIDALGGVTQTTYDADSRVIGIRRYATPITVPAATTDRVTTVAVTASALDRLEQSVYDADGREVYHIDSMGGVTRNDYDAAGNITRTIVYANAIPVVAYTSAAAVATADATAGNVDPPGVADHVVWNSYDARNRVAFAVDGTGAVTQYQYDSAGHVSQKTAYAHLVTLSSYTQAQLSDSAILQTWVTANANAATDRTTRTWYDAAGRVRFVIDATGYITENRYIESASSPRSQTTIVYVNKPTIAAGLNTAAVAAALTAQSIASSNDQSTTTIYDAAGRVTTVTDALYFTTDTYDFESYAYDAVGNKISYTNKSGSVWTYQYDANHRLTLEIDPSVAVTTVSASGSGLTSALSATTATVALQTSFQYDKLGNLKVRTEASNVASQARATTYKYDALGRQIEVDYPQVGVDSTVDNASLTGTAVVRTDTIQNLYSTTEYDTLGNAFRSRDVAGNYTYKTYDNLGRVTYEVDADNYATGYAYDAFGNKRTTTRYANALTSALPTAVGTTVATSDVTAKITVNVLDRAITTTYDRLNRQLTVTDPATYSFEPLTGTEGGTAFTAGETTSYVYNAFGQVIQQARLVNSVTGAWATTNYYYDQRGEKSAQVDSLGYLSTYAYDQSGNVTDEYQYAKALTSWSTSGYSAPVTTTATTSPNDPAGYDRETQYYYDRLNRLNTVFQMDKGSYNGSLGQYPIWFNAGSILRQTSYAYDAVGNLIVKSVNGATAVNYYDALGRLTATAAEGPNGAGTDRGDGTYIVPITEFKRDAFGNMVEQTQYANSGILNTTDITYTVAPSTDPQNADRTTYQLFDSFGRVIQSQNANGADSFTSYNARGDVVKQWQYVANNSGGVDTTVSIYQYDNLGQQTALIQPQSTNASVIVTRQSKYDAFGEIYLRGTNNGWQEYFDYDQAGHLWRTNSGDGVDKVYLYNLAGNVTAQIKATPLTGGTVINLKSAITSAALANALPAAQQERTETRYDLLGRALEQRGATFVNAGGTASTPDTAQTVDRWGNILTAKDAAGNVTNYRYDPLNNVEEILQPLVQEVNTTNGAVTTVTARPDTINYHDNNGNLLMTVDPDGNTNYVTYNTAGQIIQEHHADGTVKSYVYNTFGEQVQVTDESGYRTRNGYDKAGNLIYVAREVTTGAFTDTNPYHYTVALTNANVISLQYSYDQAGRRIGQTSGALMSDGVTPETTKYWYDLLGHVILTQSPMLHQTAYAYDQYGLGKQTMEEDALALAGITATAGGSNAQTWTYDYFGHEMGHTDLASNSITYNYGVESGLLSSVTGSVGENVVYSYDAAGHNTHIADRGAPTTAGTAQGLTSVVRDTSYGYDLAGRQSLETVKVAVDGVVADELVDQNTVTTYDTLDRLSTLTDPRYTTAYSYDAAGNRTRALSTYSDPTTNPGTVKTNDLWYTYDTMNRVAISQGMLINGTTVVVGAGIQLTYDAKGERHTTYEDGTTLHETEVSPGVYSWNEPSGYDTMTYTYDGVGRLVTGTRSYSLGLIGGGQLVVDARTYDAASRQLTQTVTSVNASGNLSNRLTTTTYDDDGRMLLQTTNKDGVNEYAIEYGASTYQAGGTEYFYGNAYTYPAGWSVGFDPAGNLRGYTLIVYDTTKSGDPLAYLSTYVNYYRLGDSYEKTTQNVTSTAGSSPAPLSGSTTNTYNVNGELVQYVDSNAGAKDRYFANNQDGQALTVIQGQYDGQSGRPTAQAQMALALSTANITASGSRSQYLNSANFFLVAGGKQIGSVQNDGGGLVTPKFDTTYTPVSDNYPAITPSTVVTAQGDTLRLVAARVYGDANLWYIIAQYNGLSDPNVVLTTGTELRIPNQVLSLHNNSTTFKPFDVQAAIGDTTPTQPEPPAPQQSSGGGGGCGVLGEILVVVVAIVVVALTQGAATELATGALDAIGVSGSVGAAVGSAAGAALAAAAGSIVSQGVGIAIGAQSSFSWNAVAGASLTAGLDNGLGLNAGAGPFSVGDIGQQALNAAVTSAVNQGVGIAVGLQKSFSWAAVAASAVAAPIANYAAQQAGGAVPGGINGTAGGIAARVASGAVTQVVNAAFTGGRINYAQVVGDAFGHALGNSLATILNVPQVSQPPLPWVASGNGQNSADQLSEIQVTAQKILTNNPMNDVADPAATQTADQLNEVAVLAEKAQSVTGDQPEQLPEITVTAPHWTNSEEYLYQQLRNGFFGFGAINNEDNAAAQAGRLYRMGFDPLTSNRDAALLFNTFTPAGIIKGTYNLGVKAVAGLAAGVVAPYGNDSAVAVLNQITSAAQIDAQTLVGPALGPTIKPLYNDTQGWMETHLGVGATVTINSTAEFAVDSLAIMGVGAGLRSVGPAALDTPLWSASADSTALSRFEVGSAGDLTGAANTVAGSVFATTDPVAVSGSRAIDRGQSYEVGVRGLYGDIPFQQRQFTALVNGEEVNGVADMVTSVAGQQTAVEAKYVDDWSTSIRNPNSPNGSEPWAVAEQQNVIDQAAKYSSGFEGGVIYHTNSQDFANYYSQAFSNAGITNFRFVITPATKF